MYKAAGAVGTLSIANPKSMDIPWARSTLARLQPAMALADLSLQYRVRIGEADRLSEEQFEQLYGLVMDALSNPVPSEEAKRRLTKLRRAYEPRAKGIAQALALALPTVLLLGLFIPTEEPFAWLLPAVGFVAVVLAASTWVSPLRAAIAVSSAWLAVVSRSAAVDHARRRRQATQPPRINSAISATTATSAMAHRRLVARLTELDSISSPFVRRAARPPGCRSACLR